MSLEIKNGIVCPKCDRVNFLYAQNCKNCKSFLRDRVVNIDLWNTLSKLLDSPIQAFTRIINAEYKNFIIFIAFLAALKILINSFLLDGHLPKIITVHNFLIEGGVLFGGFFIYLLIASLLITQLNNSIGYKSRFKDSFAIIAYSLTPLVYALVIIFPVEFVLFGTYLFNANPSPFLIKTVPAYVLSAIEIIMLLWSLTLTIFAFFAQTRSILYSIVIAIIVNIGIWLFFILL